eukprot:CAMPEP_0198235268 /NCGR_PEP_ID=MMETSP1446-20131203/1168_1 /TAXON_ID=1461542 ORGANISM="Unidentified sp, Strain CCMP2111" /NCGR_SAMPLE_ID=MMETSP1446 /ASSEMBLY_ACC=CAM_ASM_001112 /LENGTH=181 /DNA_ID=CAMNT_0043916355 /DNA_START=99 /DNA_END=645 /DNA_ORIENTATION=-
MAEPHAPPQPQGELQEEQGLDGQGRGSLADVREFTQHLPEELGLGQGKAHVLMIAMEAQVFVWVGDEQHPVMRNMHFAIKTLEGKNLSSTTVLGDKFHGMGETISQRLCSKLHVPVVCSWNLPQCTPEKMNAFANLITRSILRIRNNEEEPSDLAADTKGDPPSLVTLLAATPREDSSSRA